MARLPRRGRPGSTSGQVACGDDTESGDDTGRWWQPLLPATAGSALGLLRLPDRHHDEAGLLCPAPSPGRGSGLRVRHKRRRRSASHKTAFAPPATLLPARAPCSPTPATAPSARPTEDQPETPREGSFFHAPAGRCTHVFLFVPRLQVGVDGELARP
jgi:hypothetical protein